LGKLEDEPTKVTPLKITTLNNQKKRLRRDERVYILKSMHCIWFNLNFEEVFV
jgi:hypothetical protein